MRDIIVLAGGPSVAEYNLRWMSKYGILISVNDAALFTRPQIAFSMDRLWAEHRYKLLLTLGVPEIWLREGCDRNFSINKSNTTIFDNLQHDTTGNRVLTLSRKSRLLHGSNSGVCAINLAYTMRPDRVFLLGFDMQRGDNGEPYWYPEYPWRPNGATKPAKYVEWSREFDEIARQFDEENIPVYNVNHRSKIESFHTITFLQFRTIMEASS